MNHWLSRSASVLGILLIARAILSVVLTVGSGWELLVALLALPSVCAGILMLAGSGRVRRSPGSAAICFLLAAILGVIASEISLPIASGGSTLLSLIVYWTPVLFPIMLAVVSLRSVLRTRRPPTSAVTPNN